MTRTAANGLPVFSTSEEVAFKRCTLAHHFEYVLGYRPVMTNRRLSIGIGVHLGLEAYYKGATEAERAEVMSKWADDRWTELEAAGVQDDADQRMRFILDRDLASDMVERYIGWVLDEGLDDGWQTEEVELLRYVEIPGAPCVLPVKVDLLQRHTQTGALRILDFKTRDKFSRDTGGYFLSEQNGNYSLGIFSAYGQRPIAMVYRELRKMSPTINPRSKPPYFREIEVPLTTKELQRRIDEYIATAKQRFDPERTIPVANPFSCCGSWAADYAPPCVKVHAGLTPKEALEESKGYEMTDPYQRYDENN